MSKKPGFLKRIFSFGRSKEEPQEEIAPVEEAPKDDIQEGSSQTLEEAPSLPTKVLTRSLFQSQSQSQSPKGVGLPVLPVACRVRLPVSPAILLRFSPSESSMKIRFRTLKTC